MGKKLFCLFLIIATVGVTTVGIFSFKVMKKFYIDDSAEKLETSGKLIADMLPNQDNIDLSSMDEIAKNYSKLTESRVTIIDANGKVIGESDNESIYMDNHENRDEIKVARQGLIGKSIRYSYTEKMDMLYVAIPVNNGSGIVIRLSMPLTQIKYMQNRYLKIVMVIIFAAILISSLIAYIFSNRFIKPIKYMTKISSEIAGGRYDRRINIESKDETLELANAFNNMAQKLDDTIKDLSDKKNKIEVILESMQSGILAVDNMGKILLINPAAIDMLSIKGDVVGNHILEVIRNRDFEDFINNPKEEFLEIRLNYLENKIIRFNVAPIIDKDEYNNEEKVRTVVAMQDITELKALEQMRTDFVANVSHELKTPLTSIKGFTETLRNGAIDDKEKRDKFLDIINAETDRLTRLINDILTISELESKKQSNYFEKVNLNNVVDDIKDMMIGFASIKNIDICFNTQDNLPYVYGDFDKLKQLLINLIDNGIKYTKEGGKVCLNVYNKDQNVIIEVADTGIGIPDKHIPRLFERFYRADKGRSRALGGTGLGLAIVKHIVVSMDGKIEVISKVGVGSKFTITLPSM